MTWTIEISLIDLICRYISGICAITVLILILWEQKKTEKFLKEELRKCDSGSEDK